MLRVMTYNIPFGGVDDDGTEVASRLALVQEVVSTARPHVLAGQEANEFDLRAMNWLVEQQMRPDEQHLTDYVWILDSDCVVLRDDTLCHAAEALASAGAALCGQRSSNAWHSEETIGLYSLLFDPTQVWLDSIRPFDSSGEPSLALQLDCASAGLGV